MYFRILLVAPGGRLENVKMCYQDFSQVYEMEESKLFFYYKLPCMRSIKKIVNENMYRRRLSLSDGTRRSKEVKEAKNLISYI